MKAYELLNKPEKWTRGALGRWPNGEPCWATNDDTVCWCALGAIERCYGFGTTLTHLNRGRVAKVVRELGYADVGSWNDDPATTYEDVVKLLKELDI